MPDACVLLGQPWLNLRFPLALTICESLAIVPSCFVNLIKLFLGDMNCISQEASMRAKQCLCFNKSRLLGKDLEPVKCNLLHPLGCCPFQGGGFVVVDSLLCCCSHCLWNFWASSLFCCAVLVYNHFAEEERAVSFTLIVFLMSCDC